MTEIINVRLTVTARGFENGSNKENDFAPVAAPTFGPDPSFTHTA